MQFRLCSNCDIGSGQDGAFKNTVGSERGGTAESPEDVLRFGSVLQDESGVRSGNQGTASLEEKLGVFFVKTVQSDHSTKGEVDSAAGTVGSGDERFASDLDIQNLIIGSDFHRRSVGGQHGRGEIRGVPQNLPAIYKHKRPSNSRAGRDTHIPAVDGGEKPVESYGGSSVDSKVFTHTVGERLRSWTRSELRTRLTGWGSAGNKRRNT